MPTPKITLDLEGPFFQKDPAKTFRQNARRMVQEIADEGADKIRSIFAAGEGGRLPVFRLAPEHVAAYIVGRARSVAGKQWALTSVVSVNSSGLSRADAISLMAAGSVVERQTHGFRAFKNAVYSSRAVLTANLTEGLE